MFMSTIAKQFDSYHSITDLQDYLWEKLRVLGLLPPVFGIT